MDSQSTKAKLRRSVINGGFSAIAVIVTIICVIPYVGVLAAAASGSFETLGLLAQTVLGRYTMTTLALVALVMTGSAVIGASAAWLVTMTEFPGRRWLEIALALPLAFPAYVLAYGYTHVLDHPGIVQSTLRDVTGWEPLGLWR